MRVLVACEFSGVVRDAFRAVGHDAWSCDLLPTERPLIHNGIPTGHWRGDVLKIIGNHEWDLLIAHPPCTYLTRSGWSWVNKPDRDTLPLMGEPRRRAAAAAAEFFMLLLNAPIAHVVIENPRPICHVNLPPYSQVIQPYQFGHGETKATCLWLRNVPALRPTHADAPLFGGQAISERVQRSHRESPSPDRWKNRSRTLPGIAKAMAEQWGNLDKIRTPRTLVDSPEIQTHLLAREGFLKDLEGEQDA